MGDKETKLDTTVTNVVRLYNKVISQTETNMEDIQNAFLLTKEILYMYNKTNRKSYDKDRDLAKINFNDFIKSFIIDKNNINSKEIPLWSVSTEIVLRDLNRLVNIAIETTNSTVEFTPYLFLSKNHSRVDNSNCDCFVITSAKTYGINSLATTFNLMLKKMGMKKYMEMLLVISSLGYPETPSDILVKFNNDAKN